MSDPRLKEFVDRIPPEYSYILELAKKLLDTHINRLEIIDRTDDVNSVSIYIGKIDLVYEGETLKIHVS